MSIEANKAVAAHYLAALTAGDVDAAFAAIADDVEWIMPGRSRLAGRYTKPQLYQMLKDMNANALTPFRIHPIVMTAEDDRVAVHAESHVQFRDGRVYANEYHLLLVIRDGLIRSGREFLDTLYLAETLPDLLAQPVESNGATGRR